MRLGILASHPIQYNSPLFRSLAKRIDLEVYFAHRQTPAQQAAAGFGREFEWDVDLLEGYRYRFLGNRAPNPSVEHFLGCINPEVRSIVSDGQFDAFVVYGWHLFCYWQAVMACRAAGTPVLVRGDSHLRTPRSPARRLAKRIAYPLLLRAFDGFLVVGKRNREYLQHYGISAERLYTVPHYVDNSWFRVLAENGRATRATRRAELNVASNASVVLFVGKFIPEKRPLDVLHACQLLHTRGVDLVALFVGDGPLRSDLEAAARQLSFPVHFSGFQNQSQLPAWYALSDVLTLPSESETWGLVVNEGMACGLPAVVSESVGCAPDLVEEGRTGARFPAGDIVAFSSALERAFALAKRHETAGELNKRLESYSVEAATTGVEQALLACIARKKGSRHWSRDETNTAAKAILP